MNKKFLLLICTFFMVGLSMAQSADEKIIRNAMNEQLNAWNAGDINLFMATYWKSDSLMFVGKNGVIYGWEDSRKNYLKAYPDAAAMGKLDFKILEIKRLSVLYFFVTGRWNLTRTGGDAGGFFTLLFKKIKGQWLIVVDHSS